MPTSSSRHSFGAAQTSLNDFFKKPKLNRTSASKRVYEDFEIPSSLPERKTQRERGQPERKKRKLLEDMGQNATPANRLLKSGLQWETGLPTPPDSSRTYKAPAETRSSSPAPCTPTRPLVQAKGSTTIPFAYPQTPQTRRVRRNTLLSATVVPSSQSPEVKRGRLNSTMRVIAQAGGNSRENAVDFFCIPSSQVPPEVIPSSQTQAASPRSPSTPRRGVTGIPQLREHAPSHNPRFALDLDAWDFHVPATQLFVTPIPSSQPDMKAIITTPATSLGRLDIQVDSTYSAQPGGDARNPKDEHRRDARHVPHNEANVTILGSPVIHDGHSVYRGTSVVPETPTRVDHIRDTPDSDLMVEAFRNQLSRASSPVEDPLTSPIIGFFAMLDEPRDFSMSGSSFLNSQFSTSSPRSQFTFVETQEDEELPS